MRSRSIHKAEAATLGNGTAAVMVMGTSGSNGKAVEIFNTKTGAGPADVRTIAAIQTAAPPASPIAGRQVPAVQPGRRSRARSGA